MSQVSGPVAREKSTCWMHVEVQSWQEKFLFHGRKNWCVTCLFGLEGFFCGVVVCGVLFVCFVSKNHLLSNNTGSCCIYVLLGFIFSFLNSVVENTHSFFNQAPL